MATSGINETLAIINRYPVDLELTLGANFTERTTYTGIYNISGLGFDMSFRVQCAANCCGSSCSCKPLEGIYTCDDKGNTICVHDNRNPATDCMECEFGRDTAVNCTNCLPGRDIESNCALCLPGRDIASNCTNCLSGRDAESNCTQCLAGRDLELNCTQCLPGRNASSNCTQCLPGFTGRNCTRVVMNLGQFISILNMGTLIMSSFSIGGRGLDLALVGGYAGGAAVILIVGIIISVVLIMIIVRMKKKVKSFPGMLGHYYVQHLPPSPPLAE